MDQKLSPLRTGKHSATDFSSENEAVVDSKENVLFEAMNGELANRTIKLEDIKERMMDYHYSFINNLDDPVPTYDVIVKNESNPMDNDLSNDSVDKKLSPVERAHDSAEEEKFPAAAKNDSGLHDANALPISKSDLLKFVALVKEKKYLLEKRESNDTSDPGLENQLDTEWKQIFQEMCWTVDICKDQLEILKEEMRKRIFNSYHVEQSVCRTDTKTDDAYALFTDTTETVDVTTDLMLQSKVSIVGSEISFESDSGSEENLLIDESCDQNILNTVQSGNLKVTRPSKTLSYYEAENENSNGMDVDEDDVQRIDTTDARIPRRMQTEPNPHSNDSEQPDSKTGSIKGLLDTDSDIEIVSVVQPNTVTTKKLNQSKRNATSKVSIENSSKSTTSNKAMSTKINPQNRATRINTKKMVSVQELAKDYSRKKTTGQASLSSANVRASGSKRIQFLSVSSDEDCSDSSSSKTETDKIRRATDKTSKGTDIIDELFGKDVQKKLYGDVQANKRTVCVSDLIKENERVKSFGEPDLSEESSFYNFYKSLYADYLALPEADRRKFTKMADSIMDCFCQEQIDDNLKRARKE